MINKKPLISILIPVYNKQDYLEDCIESVIMQTYNNIEILIINDGSNDGSQEILDRYSLKDKRVRLFSQENKGISKARNFLIKKVKGEFFIPINADDFIREDFVEKLHNTLITTNSDIATCAFKTVSNFDIDYLRSDKYNLNKVKSYSKEDFYKNFVLHHLSGNKFGSDVTSIYKKNLHGNIFYPTGLSSAMDGWYYTSICLVSNKIAVIEEEMYYWRSNPLQSSKLIDKENMLSYLKYSNYLIEQSKIENFLMAELLIAESVISVYIPIRYMILIKSEHINTEIYNNLKMLLYKKRNKFIPKKIRTDIFIIKYTFGYIRRLLLKLTAKINKVRMKRFKTKQKRN